MKLAAQLSIALLTSWAARLSAAIFTVVAFPLVLKSVGASSFTAFLFALAYPAWLPLSLLGAAGALPFLVSRSTAPASSMTVRVRGGAALVLPLVLLAVAMLGAAAVAATGTFIPSIDGVGASDVRSAVLVSTVLTAGIVFGGLLEGYGLATGKVHIFNLIRIGAVASSLALIVALSPVATGIPFYVAATLAPQVVLLLAVGGWLVRRDGAVPVLSWRLIRFAAARRVWSVSGSFFLMSLPFLLCVQFGPTLAAMTKPSEDIGTLLVLMRVLVFVAAFFGALTAPAWPLLARLRASGKENEFNQKLRHFVLLAAAVAFAAATAFAVAGPLMLRLWLPSFQFDDSHALLWFAAYILVYLLNTLWLAVFSACGAIERGAVVSLLEAVGGLLLGLALFRAMGTTGYILGLVLCSLLSTTSFGALFALKALSTPRRPAGTILPSH